MREFVELAKSAGPNAGAFTLAAYSIYGGQYAARFDESFRAIASSLCIAAMTIGLAVVVFNVITAALRSSRRSR